MDTQQALKALLVAGKRDEVTTFLATYGKSAAVRYREIRANTDLSSDGQTRQLAIAYSQVRRTVDEKLSAMASAVMRDDRDDVDSVFGTKGIPGDAATLVISRRDASDRVRAAVDRRDLRDLLARATRSGDEVLARAVAERAVEEQDAQTMHQFVADRPDLEAAAERLWRAQQESGNVMALNMGLLNLRPSELGSLSPEGIARLTESAA
jgi:hypothetical protein